MSKLFTTEQVIEILRATSASEDEIQAFIKVAENIQNL